MTLNEMKRELAAILAREEECDVNWADIEFLCERTYIRLTEPGTPQNFPQEDVIGYLAGFNRRRQDDQFCAQQRQWLRAYLRT